MKFFSLVCLTVCLGIVSFSPLHAQDSLAASSIDIGYSLSYDSYASLAYSKGWFRSEARLFTNQTFLNQQDFGLIGTGYFHQSPDYRFYAGLGLAIDFWGHDFQASLPVGGILYPLANKDFGIQLEISPTIYDQRIDYMQGSLGLRFTLNDGSRKQRVRDSTVTIVKYKRGLYMTLADIGVGPGVVYSIYANDWDWHVGAGIWPLAIPYGGVYYHFRKPKPTKRIHPYAGVDAGYAFTYTPGLVVYVPVGLQMVYENGFTWTLEGSAIYVEEGFLPWCGIKFGKSFKR
ncbi:MAG: hypothetical protein RIC35_11175 [Marinoscillum sp.]